jgi:hypothetical protein
LPVSFLAVVHQELHTQANAEARQAGEERIAHGDAAGAEAPRGGAECADAW